MTTVMLEGKRGKEGPTEVTQWGMSCLLYSLRESGNGRPTEVTQWGMLITVKTEVRVVVTTVKLEGKRGKRRLTEVM